MIITCILAFRPGGRPCTHVWLDISDTGAFDSAPRRRDVVGMSSRRKNADGIYNINTCSSQRDIRVSHFNYRSHHMVGNDSFQKHTSRRISLKAGLSPVTNRVAFYTLYSSLDHGTLPDFGITAAHSVLHVRRRDCVQKVELPHRRCPIGMLVLLVQGRLRLFSHAAKRPEVELIKDLPSPMQPHS